MNYRVRHGLTRPCAHSSYLCGEDLGLGRLAIQHIPGLLAQLLHGCGTRTRGSLSASRAINPIIRAGIWVYSYECREKARVKADPNCHSKSGKLNDPQRVAAAPPDMSRRPFA